MIKKDFFFKQYVDDKYSPSFSLHDVVAMADKVSPAFFCAQLNRLLKEHGGKVELDDPSSAPPFWGLISKLPEECIGYIEIYARTDRNPTLKATLACDIILAEGIVSVVTEWSAYKDIRAEEIVSTLLAPLHLCHLQDKTYLRYDDNTTADLVQNDNLRGELKSIFALAGYPAGVGSAEKWTDCIDDLECATAIGLKGLEPGEAMNVYGSLINATN